MQKDYKIEDIKKNLLNKSNFINEYPYQIRYWAPLKSAEEIRLPEIKNIIITEDKNNTDNHLWFLFLNIVLLIYRRHFKKYLWLRKLLIKLNSKFKFLIYFNKLPFQIKKYSELLIKEKSKIIFDQSIIYTKHKAVFPKNKSYHLYREQEEYDFPKIYITQINNGIICGSSNLIFHHRSLICHDLYQFQTDYTSEELHGKLIINNKNNTAYRIHHKIHPKNFKYAASFLDACAGNYAHWITEVLPRICVFCNDEDFKNIPIIINNYLHQNLLESLGLIAEKDREIFTLPSKHSIKIENLYVVAPTGYVAFENRFNKKSNNLHGVFSKDALNLLNTRIKEQIDFQDISTYPKRIYLRRRSTMRNIINEQTIEKILLDKGFTIVLPERLSFTEQVILFHNAEVIVGPTGAACANIVFAQKNVKFIVLMGTHHNMPYRYWMHMANARGINNISYVLGELDTKNNYGFHSDFYINPDDLIACLENMEIV